MLAERGLIAQEMSEIKIKPLTPGETRKILILPDSRIVSKNINEAVITAILSTFSDLDINIGRFSSQPATDNQTVYYSSFDKLIELISSYQLIISAESLPYHLANYLHKPHFVIYNRSRHFKATFMTPFMSEHQHYVVCPIIILPK